MVHILFEFVAIYFSTYNEREAENIVCVLLHQKSLFFMILLYIFRLFQSTRIDNMDIKLKSM